MHGRARGRRRISLDGMRTRRSRSAMVRGMSAAMRVRRSSALMGCDDTSALRRSRSIPPAEVLGLDDVAEPIVQAVRARLPELDGVGDDPVAAPERGRGTSSPGYLRRTRRNATSVRPAREDRALA
jgi:hypothetical protein